MHAIRHQHSAPAQLSQMCSIRCACSLRLLHAFNPAPVLQLMYMERDALELEEIRRRIPMPMQTYYLQVQFAV